MISKFMGKCMSAAIFALLTLGFFGLAQAGQNTLPVDDIDFGCTDEKLADRYLRDFSVDVGSFGGRELCDPKVDTKKLLNDLQIIDQGIFDAKGSNLLIRGFVPADKYYDWMKGQTRGIERGNDIPFATAYNSGGYFTMQDGWAVLSTLGRVGTVIHEARHTAGYRHIPCVAGPYAGTSIQGCDATYEYGGSHAVEMEYYARVSVLGQNFHPVYQSMARMMAMGRSNIFFNKSPIQRKMALLLAKGSGQAELVLNNKLHQRTIPDMTGNLKRASFGAAFMTATGIFAIDIYQNMMKEKMPSDDYSYFKLLKQDRGQGSDIMDSDEADFGVIRHFLILNSKMQVASYDYPSGKWRPYQKTPGNIMTEFKTMGPDGVEALYFVNNSAEVYKVNPTQLNQAPRQNWNWPAHYKSFARYENNVLGLNDAGEVEYFDQGVSKGKFPALQGEKFEQMVSSPVYDAFEVNP